MCILKYLQYIESVVQGKVLEPSLHEDYSNILKKRKKKKKTQLRREVRHKEEKQKAITNKKL